MPPEEGEKLNRIESLKSKLFSKSYPTRIEHRDGFTHPAVKDVPDSWPHVEKWSNSTKKFFMKTSFFKKFFLFSIGFFILAAGWTSYKIFIVGNTVSGNNIEISVLGNAFTAGGEELPLQIEIANKNSSALDLVDLVVEYPKGSAGGAVGDTERMRESLGTIPSGAVHTENLKVTLFGEQGSTKQIRISIEYRVEGSNSIFIKEKFFDVSINSTPINLSVEAPTEVSPNQDVTINIKTAVNATKAVPGMLLRVDYPVGFQFLSAKPMPTYGNNVWDLGDLSPGASQNISLSGKMVDVFDGEEKIFHVSTGTKSDRDKSVMGVVFNSLAQTMTVKRPFIEAQLYVNGVYQNEYAIDTKTPIHGEIRWTNNLDTKINDLSIIAKVSGNAFNRKTISADQGRYDSSQDQIIWDKNSISQFAEVNSGDGGSVRFTISPLPSFGTNGVMLTSPVVTINVSISGKQPLAGNEIKNLTNSESKSIKVISDVGLAAKALYYSGPFKNTGPIPPRAEQETTYTVTWSLTNTMNNVSKIQVNSTLPPWVRFVGPINPSTENLTYNPSTKQINWNVGGLDKGAGISTAGREVSFQISLLPSLSQVGSNPTLINDAILTGHDDFANVDVRVNKTSLSTILVNDAGFPSNGDRVVE